MEVSRSISNDKLTFQRRPVTTQNDWNRGVIEEFLNNCGKVGGRFEGAPLLLLHTVGAKSSQPRANPLMYLPDGDSYTLN